MITWDSSFSTGDDTLDGQHRTLFAFINRLSVQIAAGKSCETLEDSLAFLENYAKAHFSFEGLCMHRVHCPVAGENDKAHQDFLKFLDEFKKKHRGSEFTPSAAAELQVFIEEWIVRHIRRIDTKLKPCIGGKASPAS